MWQVFLRFVAISKKHLQTYIWMVPSLFQDATYSDLGYCVPLKQALAVIPFSKANSQFHCSHPYGDRLLFIIKESLQPQILSNLLCFCRAGNVARRYHNDFDTSLISGMHILKEVCYMMTSFPAMHFFYKRVIISREHLSWSICQGHCIYFTTFIATIHYNKRCVVDLRKFEDFVYSRKTIVALWIRNHWICWYFFEKIKKWIPCECPCRLQSICTASRIYLSSKNQRSISFTKLTSISFSTNVKMLL